VRGTYNATARREGTAWVGAVPDLEGVHTWHPRSLAGLRQGLAEAIVMAEDLPDSAIPEVASRICLDVDFPVGEVTAVAQDARRKREIAAQAQRDAEEATFEAVHRLTVAGLSARDAGIVLGISHQRVAQLTPKRHSNRTNRAING